jgi:diguanylate cyclase (GGDEF)-like protein
LKTMALNTIPLFRYIDTSFSFLNDWQANSGLSTAMFLIVALAGSSLITLLILGGLWWLHVRYPQPEFRRDRFKRKPAELSSTYDDVTGLPTRRLFGTLLEQAIGRAAKTGRSFALLVVELEHFRMVAEDQGQTDSTILVRVQAARIKGVLRSTDTVARLTPDQFAMIADNLASHEEITAIVEKLQAAVGLPLTLDGHELFLTCRIGIALYPQDATGQEVLIEQAMQAVKTAKSEGQAVRFVSPAAAAAPQPMPAASSFADLLP